ncbi:MAG: outer membrane protein assembly factor BamB, partial [Pirellulaceae bacterium]
YYGWKRDEEQMKLSSESSFFTLNILDEDSRADALVNAGLKKELDGQFREALKIYQQVIEKYPKTLYRVADNGIFVPVAQYCQRRILLFPPSDLEFYRQLYDARAREAFEQAKRQYSLLGLSDITETMLATSYGGKALMELGNAALDTGHYLAALEYYTTVRDFFPDQELKTAELALKIAYCHKSLGGDSSASRDTAGRSNLTSEQLASLEKAVASIRYEVPPFHSQKTSGPNQATDDYTLALPSKDPLAIQDPVWEVSLPGTRDDFFVYTQPVVTANSVVFRHKNIVYCRSLLNGLPRWQNDLGGRATWQSWFERQFPQEDVLVQDGLVFTAINKAGPSLVALDEVTGQLKWAFGPMVAADEEQVRMRIESAPCGGPRTIFTAYVLDNIEGETHTDSEYGVVALDSVSGRIQWRTPICRLAPGKFAGGLAERRRNRIRSFTSPPVYHQGTIYYTTNAGAIAALDSLSGRVKWLTRYPYHPGIHDATRQFGRGGEKANHSRVYFRPPDPMLWYNQRPLMDGERLFTTPVDSNSIYCIDRRTGKVIWTKAKRSRGCGYLLGMSRRGELVVAYTGRKLDVPAHRSPSPIHLLDPATGEIIWESPDLTVKETHPVMTHYVFASPTLHYRCDDGWFELAARPFMTQDGRVYLSSFRYVAYPIFGYFSNLACLDIEKREIVDQRRYYSGEILARAEEDIHTNGPDELKAFEDNPVKDDMTTARIKMLKDVVADTVPENAHGPFLPFARQTVERFGETFELRISARSVSMVYDRDAVGSKIQTRSDPAGDFAKAELAVANSRMKEAAQLLQQCLGTISSEDLDFRAAINQQLYGVHLRLARQAIRSGRNDEELQNCLGMSRTAGTLAEEIETLFAVADAYQRRGDLNSAAKALRTVINTYGDHEYPISDVAAAESRKVVESAGGVIDRYGEFLSNSLYAKEMSNSLTLMKRSLPLYLSAVSPLPKTLTLRAGELAAVRLSKLRGQSEEFSSAFDQLAATELADKPDDEMVRLLGEYPSAPAAQDVLSRLLKNAIAANDAQGRLQMWKLADVARVSSLKISADLNEKISPPPTDAAEPAIELPQLPRAVEFDEEETAARLVLERRGDRTIQPQLMFVATRVRKRLDNKFIVAARDLESGKEVWETEELRLKGKGQEPGFYSAFVHGDLVLVHGLYDVLALSLKDGKLRWRYRVPFDFEIRSASLSGDLLLLAGKIESIALYAPTDNVTGEVAWQAQELGDLYIPPYMDGDRMISVRKLPFNVTVRYRATGRLIGRLDLPDLSMLQDHPLLENGPKSLPTARHENQLVLTDGWYYILIDTNQLQIVWKRLIDNNDATRTPPLRFALGRDHLAVLKEDYDQKAIHLLSAETGEVLWATDPKNSQSPRPMHSMFIHEDRLYGIEPHPGQAFYFSGRVCTTGKSIFRTEVSGYQAKPQTTLLPRIYGNYMVARTADRQDFDLKSFNLSDGKLEHSLRIKGVGPYDIHGRISTTVQHGRLVMLSKDTISQ